MRHSTNLAPELEQLARIVDGQPPQVRELFHYGITTLMVENGKAEAIETRVIDEREHITYRTVAGEIFPVVKPDVSDAMLGRLKEMAREVLAEEDDSA